jgi:SAM-dependent methyltransferase
MTSRIEREKEFWNTHFPPTRYDGWTQKDYHSWSREMPRKGAFGFLGDVAGKRLLCCGVGSEAVVLAGAGADVWGFDISDEQVSAVDELARKWDLAKNVHVDVMPFEKLIYDNGKFDLAYGSAILHHVDLDLGGRELARVLRPGGRAAFVEPLAENPLLNYARNRLPYPHKIRTEDESPMTYQDIARFGRAFRTVEHHEMSLLGMWRKILPSLGPVLDGTDKLLLAIPGMNRLCAQTWIGVTT